MRTLLISYSRSRRAQQKKIKMDLEEAVVEVGIHQKNMNDQSFTPEKQPLLQLERSINQYVDRVVVQDKADRRARRRYPRSSVLMSDSSATTPTQSTQPSDHPRQTPESPPTSPEPSIARSPSVEVQPAESKPSPTIPVLCSLRKFQPLRLTPIKLKQMTSSGPSPDTPLSQLPEPDVPPADEVRWIMHVDPKILGQDEDDSEDGMPEEDVPAEEQATRSKPSIWRNTTGVFEGDMPKSLRIRRQESRSP